MNCLILLLSIRQGVGSTDGLAFKHQPGFHVILTRFPALLGEHQNSTVQHGWASEFLSSVNM